LDECTYLKVIGKWKVWRSKDGKRLFTWDTLHGEIEVFHKTGYHMGSADPITGKYIKPGVKGRTLHV